MSWMPTALSVFARRFLINEASVLADLDHPVLLWEKPPSEGRAQADLTKLVFDFEWALRGKDAEPSTSSEPLVFRVRPVKPEARAKSPVELTLGRTEENDLAVEHESVSRFHAVLQQDLKTQLWTLIDTGSRNGTWMAGEKLAPNQPLSLQDRAQLRFGNVDLQFLLPGSFVEYLRSTMPQEFSEAPRRVTTADNPIFVMPELGLSLSELDTLVGFHLETVKLLQSLKQAGTAAPAVTHELEKIAASASRVLTRLNAVATKLRIPIP